MASANVREFTDANFQSEVLSSQQPVLVDFWAEWCMPCRALTPTIEKIADQFAGKAKVGKVNTDNNQMTGAKYNINAIPTVLVFKNGQVVDRIVGLKNESDFVAALQRAGA